jgi:hypothetical protein
MIVSHLSMRPSFFFGGLKEKRGEKRKCLSPYKMLFPARLACSLKAEAAARLAAFPGVRSHRLAGHFVRAAISPPFC